MVWIPKSEWRKQYNAYITSRAWRRFRETVLEAGGHKCARCPRTEKLQVHHKTYKRLFHEHIGDCEILCWWCHRAEHPNKRIWRKRVKKKPNVKT